MPTWQAPDLIPSLSYRDAPAAIDWLERAFGFERVLVAEGENGRIAHAELRIGSGMLMLGSTSDRFDVKVPDEAGGVTAGIYVIVDDADAHHDRARAAGAEIIAELDDKPYGSRDYSARDPEGHLWHFGTYRPAVE
jgi:uncharacterized glyoxalase superfamily protein PhnB